MQKLIDRGAEGIILGCTEIGLLIQQNDAEIPLFDTAKIHVEAAVKEALDH
ncbi:aspartate/glutamate racemase family protein [Halomonas sp. SIMBA_159]